MSDAPDIPIAAEFSVPVDLRAEGRRQKTYKLSPNAEERALIAQRLKVPGVEKLEGDVSLDISKTEIKASGSLSAELTRECVASLEQMTETVEETFEVAFERGQATAPNDTPEHDAEDWEGLEIHEGDVFDLGEFLIQQLSLAMEPFPRKPGAPSLADQFGEDKSISPFAELSRMKQDN